MKSLFELWHEADLKTKAKMPASPDTAEAALADVQVELLMEITGDLIKTLDDNADRLRALNMTPLTALCTTLSGASTLVVPYATEVADAAMNSRLNPADCRIVLRDLLRFKYAYQYITRVVHGPALPMVAALLDIASGARDDRNS
jgi:hypothetical protein